MVKIDSKFKYIKEEIIESIKKFYKEHGRVPKIHEFTRKDGYPGRYAAEKYFGSWNNLIMESGFETNRLSNLTPEELLDYLTLFEDEYGRPPTIRELNDTSGNPKYPSRSHYNKYFGSLENAKKLVGQDLSSLARKGVINSKLQKGRLGEIFVLDHFIEEGAIDLAGENCNSSIDGICPKKQKYDAKSSVFIHYEYKDYWGFILNKIEADFYYLLAFNEDYSELEHVWRIPAFDFADVRHLHIHIKDLEKMRKYEITDKFKPIFDNWLKNIPEI